MRDRIILAIRELVIIVSFVGFGVVASNEDGLWHVLLGIGLLLVAFSQLNAQHDTFRKIGAREALAACEENDA